MPRQKPGRSKQDVATPPEFIRAVEAKFGLISFDLAADPTNVVGPGVFFGEDVDSLQQDWTERTGNLWLNPPYSKIEPWVAKCAETRRVTNARIWDTDLRFEQTAPLRTKKILLLVPASVGSNWFAEHVFHQAFVWFLRPRITFVGHEHPYPKDLILAAYESGFGASQPDCEIWKWK